MRYLKVFENFDDKLYDTVDKNGIDNFVEKRKFEEFSKRELDNIKSLFEDDLIVDHRLGYVFYSGISHTLTNPPDFIDIKLPSNAPKMSNPSNGRPIINELRCIIWKFDDNYYVMGVGVHNERFGAFVYRICDGYDGLKQCILDTIKTNK